jgi:DNA (cytosine-5)-methyltransferase 1
MNAAVLGWVEVRIVELFCGAGGMSLGLQRAGCEIIQAYDSWDKAVEVYRRNVGSHVWRADLKDIFRIGPMLAALAPDMICGGPPCQDFSAAGERVEGERAALTRAFAMLVAIVRPQWFVMENVPLAARSQAWTDARAMLVKAGYGLTESKLDASLYGVPQRRRRLFVIGRLGEQHGFLESALASARSAQPMTIRNMLGNALGDACYFQPRVSGNRGIWSTDGPAPTICRSSKRPIPPNYKPHPADAALVETGAFFTRPFYEGRGVRTLDEPAPAVIRTTRERPRPHYLANPHPADPVPATQAAVLTQEQVSRIQGFPIEWDWSSAPSRDVDQMIANAVPAALAEAIGRVILAREAGESIPEIQGQYGQWLRRRHGFSKLAIRNAKSRLNRARRLLHGRTFADAALELSALESVPDFARLSKGVRSDLRAALRLYREWQGETARRTQTNKRASTVINVMAA